MSTGRESPMANVGFAVLVSSPPLFPPSTPVSLPLPPSPLKLSLPVQSAQDLPSPVPVLLNVPPQAY